MHLKSFFFCLFSFILIACAEEPKRFTEMTTSANRSTIVRNIEKESDNHGEDEVLFRIFFRNALFLDMYRRWKKRPL